MSMKTASIFSKNVKVTERSKRSLKTTSQLELRNVPELFTV